MKYSKPKLLTFSSYEAAAVCHGGSGANSSGCTDGGSVGSTCHLGNGIIGFDCIDGNSPGGANKVCALGSDPLNNFTRCVSLGNSPS